MSGRRKRRSAPTRRAASGEKRGAASRAKLWLVAVSLGLFLALLFGGAFLVQRGVEERPVERLLLLVPGFSVDITLPEGLDSFQMAERLEQAEVCAAQDFLRATRDAALLGRIGLPYPDAEGFLFPAKYRFLFDTPAEQVVERLVKEALKRQARLTSGRPSTMDGLTWVTLASMVEKESGQPGERPRIAQVFLNRLADPGGETKGRLQSDPTAAYGCKRLGAALPSCAGFSGKVTPALLRDETNPYNTYRRPGLPPSPIANPGEASLRAVLQPSGGKELYFVADGSGGHVFSNDFESHRRAIRSEPPK